MCHLALCISACFAAFAASTTSRVAASLFSRIDVDVDVPPDIALLILRFVKAGLRVYDASDRRLPVAGFLRCTEVAEVVERS